MITPRNVGQQVSQVIAAHIAATGVTRKHVYTTANMSRDKFDARMRNGEAFTIDQLIRIADALRIEPALLFKPLTEQPSEVQASLGALAA